MIEKFTGLVRNLDVVSLLCITIFLKFACGIYNWVREENASAMLKGQYSVGKPLDSLHAGQERTLYLQTNTTVIGNMLVFMHRLYS